MKAVKSKEDKAVKATMLKILEGVHSTRPGNLRCMLRNDAIINGMTV